MSLFQQSYKVFKGKFFKIRFSKFDPTLLDEFPLYRVQEPGLKRPRCLEDLTSHDREVCEFFSRLGVVFNTAELIKFEYNPGSLEGYIGMVLNAEKRRQLAEVALQRKAAPGSSAADAPTLADNAPGPYALVPVDHRQKGVVKAIAFEDEDTYSGIVFTRKRKADVAVPSPSHLDAHAPSYREHPSNTSFPRDLMVQEGMGLECLRG
ncbi:uncharacterized protein [Phaseolus vulgaris]|uniref:uncharacterized protein n=1 Tax=Phaseolus vulgaris TaxID=3885 RepID=UPI0035CB2FA6